jgi:hypothetical protein
VRPSVDGGKLRYAELHQYLIPPTIAHAQGSTQRLTLYGAQKVTPQDSLTFAKDNAGKRAKSPSKKASTKKSGASLQRSVGTPIEHAPTAEDEAREIAALAEVLPELFATFKIVVVQPDCATRELFLEVHIAPVVTLPPLPATIRPVLIQILRYYGEKVDLSCTSKPAARSAHLLLGARAVSQLYDRQAAAIAAGTASGGEHAIDSQRFVSACSTLSIAPGAIAQCAFTQVSRERAGALLGEATTWAALCFCFVRAMSFFPLSRRPSHRWAIDSDAILSLATSSLLPLQYNLGSAAAIGRAGCSFEQRDLRHDESVVPTAGSPVFATAVAQYGTQDESPGAIPSRPAAPSPDALPTMGDSLQPSISGRQHPFVSNRPHDDGSFYTRSEPLHLSIPTTHVAPHTRPVSASPRRGPARVYQPRAPRPKSAGVFRTVAIEPGLRTTSTLPPKRLVEGQALVPIASVAAVPAVLPPPGVTPASRDEGRWKGDDIPDGSPPRILAREQAWAREAFPRTDSARATRARTRTPVPLPTALGENDSQASQMQQYLSHMSQIWTDSHAKLTGSSNTLALGDTRRPRASPALTDHVVLKRTFPNALAGGDKCSTMSDTIRFTQDTAG